MDESAVLKVMELPPQKRIPHMRTVDNIVKELKALDPGCEVSTYFIRQLVKKGYLRALPSGVKVLINLWDVLDLMSVGVPQEPGEYDSAAVGGIRRVEV